MPVNDKHMLRVSTPSRICLFGEHQDYLGLEVIAAAISLRFTTRAVKREDEWIVIHIRDRAISELGQKNPEGKMESFRIDLTQPIVYDGPRDYFKSAVTVLRSEGVKLSGAEVWMDSDIPIGKGMCSSTTMTLAFVAALAGLYAPRRAADAPDMARLAWRAEVEEFHEPGGKMDHYASALGALVHMDFRGEVETERLDARPEGCFLLFDTLRQKDTLRILSESKIPTLEALALLAPFGVSSVRDFYAEPELMVLLDRLDAFHRRKLAANIANYRIQREALALLRERRMTDARLGALLNAHHQNLRDGLGISTPEIEEILSLAIRHGAYGGKFNGSGGGGCLFVYAPEQRAQEILRAVAERGYPGALLAVDDGLSVAVQ